MPALPPLFEQLLLKFIKNRYLKNAGAGSLWNRRDTAYFAKGIAALNKNFTQNRAGKYRNYFNDPILRSGYLAYFLPVNAAKVLGILNRHLSFNTVPREINMADIGAGPLTLSFGFLFFLMQKLKDRQQEVRVAIDAFELNKKILGDGISLMQAYLKESGWDKTIVLKIVPRVGNVLRQNMSSQTYDYVLIGNFLNEFDKREMQIQLVMSLLKKCSHKGTKILFLEPGSKKITRDLQHLRDALTAQTPHTVIAPCLHQHQCPLNLTAKSDWCNFEQRWQAPAFIRDFDAITELKKQYLLYSYLLLEHTSQQPVHTKQEFVAISDVMKAKGRLEIIGCGPAGRIRFIKSNRDASDPNADFDRLTRGRFFTMPNYPHGDGFELNRNVGIKKTDHVITKNEIS